MLLRRNLLRKASLLLLLLPLRGVLLLLLLRLLLVLRWQLRFLTTTVKVLDLLFEARDLRVVLLCDRVF